MAISDQLTSINTSKLAIKAALTAKGLTPSNTLSTYAGNIDSLSTGVSDAWVRPADWLPMPTVLATEEKFVGLYAVFPHAEGLENSTNFVGIAIGNSGGVTVDWGDSGGVTETLAGNTPIYHTYDYAKIPSTSNCTRGYRQVLITVTATGVGNKLQGFTLDTKYFRVAGNYVRPWLDIVFSSPLTSLFYIASASLAMSMTERVRILSMGAVTNFNTLFQGMGRLESISLPNTLSVTDMGFMFNGCSSLKTVPLFATNNVTVITSMFKNCSSLKEIPLYNLAKVTIANGLFENCNMLLTVPSFDFAELTNASFMFNPCKSMVEIPAMSTPKCTNFASFSRDNPSLIKMGLMDTSKATTVGLFAYNCPQLRELPAWDMSSAVSLYQAFDLNKSINSSLVYNVKASVSYASLPIPEAGIHTIFNNLPNLPIRSATFTDVGDIINAPNHGFENGRVIKFPTINTTFGLSTNGTYYVINAQPDSFQVSTALGGAAAAFVNDGTGTYCLRCTITINTAMGGSAVTNKAICATTKGSNDIVVSGSTLIVAWEANNVVYVSSATGILQNQKITFTAVGNNSTLVVGQTYYMVNLISATRFKVALTPGGEPITFTGSGAGSDTTLITEGMQVTGTGSPLSTEIAVTFTTNKVVLTAHGLFNNDLVTFPVVNNNLTAFVSYYVINKTADNFDLSLTVGGGALTFTEGIGTMMYDSVVSSISMSGTTATVTMSRPMTETSATKAMGFRTLKTSIAILKNWGVA